MSLPIRNKYEIYSADKWGLDPLYHTNMKMLISMINKLTELSDIPHIYFYKDHQVSKVTLVGFISLLVEYETFLSMSLCDSSGTITCNLMKETESEVKIYPKIQLGEMYSIKGLIKYSEYNKKREINISHIELCKDVNIEIEHILKVIKYTKTYYDIPFISANEQNTDTSQNYKKIMEEMKNIIFDYCYRNNTNVIDSNNNEIIECIRRIRRIENISEIHRLVVNYLNQLTKYKFLEYDSNNNSYIFTYYYLINYIYDVFKAEKRLISDIIVENVCKKYTIPKNDSVCYCNILLSVFMNYGIIFMGGDNEYSLVE